MLHNVFIQLAKRKSLLSFVITLVLFSVVSVSVPYEAQAVSRLTGCLSTNAGLLYALKSGANPISSCPSGDPEVSWSLENITSGWMDVSDTWTYASSTTITVPSDATTKYSVGDKIRLKQGGGYKYFYVVGVSSTTLTVTGGSDYSVANAAITDNSFSNVVSPLHFPQWFSYNPTSTGFSSDPTSVTAKFNIIGKQVTYYVLQGAAGTSNSTSFTISLPVDAASTARTLKYAAQVMDNGTDQTTPGVAEISNTTSVVDVYKNWAFGSWTASGGKKASFTVIYDIN